MEIKYTVKKVKKRCNNDQCIGSHYLIGSKYRIGKDPYSYTYDCCPSNLTNIEHVKKMLKDQAEFTESEVKKNDT